MNLSLIKSLRVGCWIGIATLGIYYILASTTPFDYSIKIGKVKINIPQIDPLVHLDTKYYVLEQQMYNFHTPEYSPNQFLIDKSKKFYSSVGTESYVKTFYRPDFENYPTETLLVFLFRTSTFISIALILYLMSQVFSSIISGNAFDKLNQKRFFWISLLFILISILRVLHSTALAGFLKYDTKLLGYEIEPSFQALWLVLVGITFLVFSIIYGQLISLHEEQKLTI